MIAKELTGNSLDSFTLSVKNLSNNGIDAAVDYDAHYIVIGK